uniref:Uncharacterized protein n=1 Tax=Erpetoichthys calabaricus TaxID=27687 RepID=A0A8C4T9W5_ERPCA
CCKKPCAPSRSTTEWLKKLALETTGINKVHLGSYTTMSSGYLNHTQVSETLRIPAQFTPEKVKVEVKKLVKIGCPGYKVSKQRGSEPARQSAKVKVPDRCLQYLLFAARPFLEPLLFSLYTLPLLNVA